MFDIRHDETDGIAIVRLYGELRRDEVELVDRTIERLVGGDGNGIVLDMAGVSHADFRALGTLFGRAERLERSGVELRTVNMRAYVREVFRYAFPGTGGSLLGESVSATRGAVDA
jgi:anti-anti-sigma factor